MNEITTSRNGHFEPLLHRNRVYWECIPLSIIEPSGFAGGNKIGVVDFNKIHEQLIKRGIIHTVVHPIKEHQGQRRRCRDRMTSEVITVFIGSSKGYQESHYLLIIPSVEHTFEITATQDSPLKSQIERKVIINAGKQNAAKPNTYLSLGPEMLYVCFEYWNDKLFSHINEVVEGSITYTEALNA